MTSILLNVQNTQKSVVAAIEAGEPILALVKCQQLLENRFLVGGGCGNDFTDNIK